MPVLAFRRHDCIIMLVRRIPKISHPHRGPTEKTVMLAFSPGGVFRCAKRLRQRIVVYSQGLPGALSRATQTSSSVRSILTVTLGGSRRDGYGQDVLVVAAHKTTDRDNTCMEHAEPLRVLASIVISCLTTFEASVAMLSYPVRRFRTNEITQGTQHTQKKGSLAAPLL